MLNRGRFFANLDLAGAHLQVEVDGASRELLTIDTNHGLFYYNRLHFRGQNCLIFFQQLMDTVLPGISEVVAYLDDIIIVATL